MEFLLQVYAKILISPYKKQEDRNRQQNACHNQGPEQWKAIAENKPVYDKLGANAEDAYGAENKSD